jgi:hypothetical protein
MFNIKPIPVGNLHDDTAEWIAKKIDRRMMNRSSAHTWAVGYDRHGKVYHIEIDSDSALFLRKLKIIGHYKRKVNRDWLIEDIQAVMGNERMVA